MLGAVTICKLELDDPSRARGQLEDIEEFVQRGSQLARQLLLFSRHEAPVTGRMDLRVLIEESMRLLGRLLRENIRVEVELGDDPLWVNVDRGQFHQVIMNLVINAADAMPEGGVLGMSAGITSTGSIWFEVSDTGAGIPEELRSRIFEPFFTTKRAGEGTGLGLSVVHGIVSEHRGSIELREGEGEGSVFRITLPRSLPEEPAPSASPARLESDRGSGERVLLVEDHDAVRTVLAQMLERLGYRPIVAGSAEEALRICSMSSFDVLLSDLMLPGMSGRELAIALRERWPDLPVMLMSGYAADELSNDATGLSELVVLHKPISHAVLAGALRRCILGH
jgi:CheY-like chemotaxis protein